MSFLSQAFLLEKYGPRLTMQELAEVLGIAHGTLRNRLSAGTFKGSVTRIGAGFRPAVANPLHG